jgi:hypothetical protein
MFLKKNNPPNFPGLRKSGLNFITRSHLDGSNDKPSTFTVKLYSKQNRLDNSIS